MPGNNVGTLMYRTGIFSCKKTMIWKWIYKIYLLTHYFIQQIHLLSTYYKLSTILGAGNLAVTKSLSS